MKIRIHEATEGINKTSLNKFNEGVEFLEEHNKNHHIDKLGKILMSSVIQ